MYGVAAKVRALGFIDVNVVVIMIKSVKMCAVWFWANNSFLRGAGLAVCLGIAGCANLPKKPLNDAFSTHIFANNNKQFTYVVNFAARKVDEEDDVLAYLQATRNAQNESRASVDYLANRYEEDERYREQVVLAALVRAEKALAASGYCREGHMIIERHVYHSAARIRGECSELATAQDRTRFANSQNDVVKASKVFGPDEAPLNH